MTDHDLLPDATLPPADRAVAYLLDRIQRDPDLRWLMVGTEAFALLCAAEAHRLGLTPAAATQRLLERQEGTLHPDALRIPRMLQLEAVAIAAEDLAEFLQNRHPSATETKRGQELAANLIGALKVFHGE